MKVWAVGASSPFQASASEPLIVPRLISLKSSMDAEIWGKFLLCQRIRKTHNTRRITMSGPGRIQEVTPLWIELRDPNGLGFPSYGYH